MYVSANHGYVETSDQKIKIWLKIPGSVVTHMAGKRLDKNNPSFSYFKMLKHSLVQRSLASASMQSYF